MHMSTHTDVSMYLVLAFPMTMHGACALWNNRTVAHNHTCGMHNMISIWLSGSHSSPSNATESKDQN